MNVRRLNAYLSLWVGAATFHCWVGLSRTTGQVTHHIDGNVDAERGHVAGALQEAVAALYWLDGFHTGRGRHNGSGDRWHADGRLAVVAPGMPSGSQAQGE